MLTIKRIVNDQIVIAVSINLKHIAEGWGKSMGWLEITEDCAKLSQERLNICATCPFAEESSFLKVFRKEAKDLNAIGCKKCGCPVNEKTLVTDEKCPLNKW